MIPAEVKLIFLGTALLFAFSAGWAVNGWRINARIAQQHEAMQKQKDGYDEVARFLVAQNIKQKAETQRRKDKRDARIGEVSDNRVCFANWAAVQLWNESISNAPDVPANPGGATALRGAAAVTDADIQRNANENGKRWAGCRGNIDAIKALDREWFGERTK